MIEAETDSETLDFYSQLTRFVVRFLPDPFQFITLIFFRCCAVLSAESAVKLNTDKSSTILPLFLAEAGGHY